MGRGAGEVEELLPGREGVEGREDRGLAGREAGGDLPVPGRLLPPGVAAPPVSPRGAAPPDRRSPRRPPPPSASPRGRRPPRRRPPPRSPPPSRSRSAPGRRPTGRSPGRAPRTSPRRPSPKSSATARLSSARFTNGTQRSSHSDDRRERHLVPVADVEGPAVHVQLEEQAQHERGRRSPTNDP